MFFWSAHIVLVFAFPVSCPRSLGNSAYDSVIESRFETVAAPPATVDLLYFCRAQRSANLALEISKIS